MPWVDTAWVVFAHRVELYLKNNKFPHFFRASQGCYIKSMVPSCCTAPTEKLKILYQLVGCVAV